MDKNTILDAMEYIDPKLIEDADHGIKSGRSVFKRSMLIAACICLLVTTALAAGYFFAAPEVEYHKSEPHVVTGELKDSFRPILNKEDGLPDCTKVPLSCFNEALLADVANKPEDQKVLYFYFDDWSDLEEYVGFKLWDNPVLDTAEPWHITVTTPIDDEVETHGYMFCTEIDNIMTGLHAKAVYHMNPTEVPSGYAGINNTVPVSITIESAMYTEHSPIEESRMFSSLSYQLGTDFTDELYLSPNGCEFRIVRVEQHDSHGDLVDYFGMVCINNVYIMVRSTFYPDETVALATLKEVLDGFVIG